MTLRSGLQRWANRWYEQGLEGIVVLGAIAGDIIGSVYEHSSHKSTDFELFSPGCRFTDDTVLTVALAEAILHGADYGRTMKNYYRRYPHAGYGGFFHRWARSEDSRPYNSWGNGAAMRISPVGFAYDTLEEVLARAETFTAITHNHPEGIKGAQATAAAVFLARKSNTKEEIKAASKACSVTISPGRWPRSGRVIPST